jgi:GH15 family glucan-1,4-alpha-glucosidase
VALSWNDAEPPSNATEAFDLMQSTARFWRRWLRDAELPDHRFKPYLERSALTLKGLTYAPTGAMLAAATTSLPETPGGERNWDYRYTWVRDSTFILWALRALGLHLDAEEFFAFLLETVGPQGFELQIMYGIGGERELTESTLDHLTGYEGARPVRIGNGAYDQRQHDVWGTILDAVLMHGRHIESAPDIVWQGLRKVVEAALEHWREPDRGIWEVRGEPKHFTSSKVMCWVAADRGARLAERRGDPIAEEWRAAADEIHAEVCERGVDKRGVFTQHYDTDALDAAALLMPLYGFLPGSDPRIRHTVLAIADELTENGLVLRYRVDATDDGLSGEEGTFTICSFWLVSALSEIGEAERARALCERLLSHASPLGLYAEEIEASSGRHLGNFPQAFTHLALINAVLHVVHDEQENGAP